MPRFRAEQSIHGTTNTASAANGVLNLTLKVLPKDLVQEDERLTQREKEVLQPLAEGKVMKEVGNILNIGGPCDALCLEVNAAIVSVWSAIRNLRVHVPDGCGGCSAPNPFVRNDVQRVPAPGAHPPR